MSVSCARCDRSGAGTAEALPNGWQLHVFGTVGAKLPVCPDCLDKSKGRSTEDDGGSVQDNQLRLFIERVERMEEEKKGISDDIRDTYSEMKAQGYDAKIVKEVIKIRRMAPNERAEHQMLLDTYCAALGIAL